MGLLDDAAAAVRANEEAAARFRDRDRTIAIPEWGPELASIVAGLYVTRRPSYLLPREGAAQFIAEAWPLFVPTIDDEIMGRAYYGEYALLSAEGRFWMTDEPRTSHLVGAMPSGVLPAHWSAGCVVVRCARPLGERESITYRSCFALKFAMLVQTSRYRLQDGCIRGTVVS